MIVLMINLGSQLEHLSIEIGVYLQSMWTFIRDGLYDESFGCALVCLEMWTNILCTFDGAS